MEYEAARDELIKRIWLIGAADQMITKADALRRLEQHRQQKTASYVTTEWHAVSALIALRDMGLVLFDKPGDGHSALMPPGVVLSDEKEPRLVTGLSSDIR